MERKEPSYVIFYHLGYYRVLSRVPPLYSGYLLDVCVCVCVRAQSLSCVQLFATPMDCNPQGSSVRGIPPSKNTGAGSSLLQGIFPIQGSNKGLLHCRWILYHLCHQRRCFAGHLFSIYQGVHVNHKCQSVSPPTLPS